MVQLEVVLWTVSICICKQRWTTGWHIPVCFERKEWHLPPWPCFGWLLWLPNQNNKKRIKCCRIYHIYTPSYSRCLVFFIRMLKIYHFCRELKISKYWGLVRHSQPCNQDSTTAILNNDAFLLFGSLNKSKLTNWRQSSYSSFCFWW